MSNYKLNNEIKEKRRHKNNSQFDQPSYIDTNVLMKKLGFNKINESNTKKKENKNKLKDENINNKTTLNNEDKIDEKASLSKSQQKRKNNDKRKDNINLKSKNLRSNSYEKRIIKKDKNIMNNLEKKNDIKMENNKKNIKTINDKNNKENNVKKKEIKKEVVKQIKNSNSSTFRENQKYKRISQIQPVKIMKFKRIQEILEQEEMKNVNRTYYKKMTQNQDRTNNNEDFKIQEEFLRETNYTKRIEDKKDIKIKNNKLEKKDEKNKKPKKNKNMSADKILSINYDFKSKNQKKKKNNNRSDSEKNSESEKSNTSGTENTSEEENEKSEDESEKNEKTKKEKNNSSKKGKKEKMCEEKKINSPFKKNIDTSNKNEGKDNHRPSIKRFSEISSLNNNENDTKIKGTKYLRRRSLDNPALKEKYESLFNNMILKQNGGDSFFLKNYENGPSYKKEIELLINNKKVKKKIKIFSCTKAGCSGPGIVKTNQDSYTIKENFLKNDIFFLGVFDGHGEKGELVSKYAAKTLPEYIKDLNEENIINIFKKINNEIYSNKNIESDMSGTTAVSLFITSEKMICANLGDSRASLFKYEDGLYYCKNLSRDHKPSEPDENKRIILNNGRIKKCYDEENKKYFGPDRVWLKNKDEPGLAVTRSLGDKIAHDVGVSDEPEIKNFEYDGTEKFIIIASDGIWEYLRSDECIRIVRHFIEDDKDSDEVALSLVKEAFRKWKRKEIAIDDITAIVVIFDD